MRYRSGARLEVLAQTMQSMQGGSKPGHCSDAKGRLGFGCASNCRGVDEATMRE
jgi:hypothetical protein